MPLTDKTSGDDSATPTCSPSRITCWERRLPGSPAEAVQNGKSRLGFGSILVLRAYGLRCCHENGGISGMKSVARTVGWVQSLDVVSMNCSWSWGRKDCACACGVPLLNQMRVPSSFARIYCSGRPRLRTTLRCGCCSFTTPCSPLLLSADLRGGECKSNYYVFMVLS